MPAAYILGHLLVCAILAGCIFRGGKPGAAHNAAVIAALVTILLGFYIDRRSDLVWRLMSWFGSGLVYLTNVSLDGVTVMAALMWRLADGKRQRIRAALFILPLLGASMWSYAWFFQLTPAGIDGTIDKSGLCMQSTPVSCSAASAVMLLNAHGISSTEEEMARLCLTRSEIGTSPAGLFRGLAAKSAPYGLHPKADYFSHPEQLRLLHSAAIINVGLKLRLDPKIADRMRGYGWSTGSGHSVVVIGTDPTGDWIDVADPTNGKERWPADDLNYLWDGCALVLVK